MATSYINLAEIEVFGAPASVSEITPLEIQMSSVWTGQHHHFTELPGSLCHDNNLDTKCHTKGGETRPWVAIEIPRSKVQKVKITNRRDCCGDRTKDMKIWVGDRLPITAHFEYSGGALLGTFKGPGKNGEVIERSSEEGLIGNFVIVQMEITTINLAEIEVFGVPAPAPA